jgi:hypothetical protein
MRGKRRMLYEAIETKQTYFPQKTILSPPTAHSQPMKRRPQNNARENSGQIKGTKQSVMCGHVRGQNSSCILTVIRFIIYSSLMLDNK